ncbi:vitamin B12 dependent-methionine synthase activation domain-containing protein [Atopobiaceae bacterium 24-176]
MSAAAGSFSADIRAGAGSFSPDRSEVLRYLGHRGQELGCELEGRLSAVMARAAAEVRPRWVWRVCPVEPAENGVAVLSTELVLSGRSMEVLLDGAAAVALMAVTCGPGPDAVAVRDADRDPVGALIFDACAVDLVEQGADACNRVVDAWAAASGLVPTRRYSPGYGDLPLAVQPALLDALDARRRLGVSLTDSLLMVPMKSVTAVVGLVPAPARPPGEETP